MNPCEHHVFRLWLQADGKNNGVRRVCGKCGYNDFVPAKEGPGAVERSGSYLGGVVWLIACGILIGAFALGIWFTI